MAAAFCSHCGQPVSANARFCPACGSNLAAPPPLAGGPALLNVPRAAPLPGAGPYAYAYQSTSRPTPSSAAVDRRALSSVFVAALVGLGGVILSLMELILNTAYSIVSSTTTPGGQPSFTINLNGLYLVAIFGAVGVVFAVVELWFYRSAFRTLEWTDGNFTTPAKLALLALISIVFVVLLAAALLNVVAQAAQCAGPGNPVTSACLNGGEVLGLVGLLLLVGIFAFIGYIGLLIGIWRMGIRYDNVYLKVAAVLMIFPVLNIVANILIVTAARSIRDSLPGGRPPAPFG